MNKMTFEVLDDDGDRVVLRCANDVIRRIMNPAEKTRRDGTGEDEHLISEEVMEALENCFPPEEDTPMPGEPGFHWGL